MTLACKTVDLLALTTQALVQLMSNQHDLRSTNERKSALTQLVATVQAAARLAEIAHVETLGPGEAVASGGMEAQNVDSVVEETQRIKAETERSVAETTRLHAEWGKVERETERTREEVKRAVAETERLKAQAMVVRSEKMKIDAETERLKAETERMRRVEEQICLQTEAEVENAGEVSRKAVAENGRNNAEVETVVKGVEPPVQVQKVEGVGPCDKLLTLQAEIKRKSLEALRAVQLGIEPTKLEHLASEISELAQEARLERDRENIRTRAETERVRLEAERNRISEEEAEAERQRISEEEAEVERKRSDALREEEFWQSILDEAAFLMGE